MKFAYLSDLTQQPFTRRTALLKELDLHFIFAAYLFYALKLS